MLTAKIEEEELQLTAISLICFYVRRHQAKRKRKILNSQIKHYPLLKKLLSHLLCYVIRRRFCLFRHSIILIQSAWKRFYKNFKVDSEIFMISDDETIENDFSSEENSFTDILCPSPAVLFRGNLLTTPRSIKMAPKRILKSPSKPDKTIFDNRTVPLSFNTPMRTSKIAVKLTHERLGKSSLGTPLKSPCRGIEILANSITSVKLALPARDTTPGRAQRVARKNSFSIPDEIILGKPKRQVGEETILARETEQNTRLNSGYRTCDLLCEEIVRDGERPGSPSNTFSKSSSGKHKWNNPASAEAQTRKNWISVSEQISPTPRRIKWSHDIHFLDQNTSCAAETFCPRDHHNTNQKSIIKSLTMNILEDYPLKNVVKIQRVIYESEVKPIQVRTPVKRKARE